MSIRLKTLLGDHPVSAPLKSGAIASPLVTLDFADVAVPNRAFKRVVRDLEFDVAELAIATFLMARGQDVPITLLPVVVFARAQHPFLVHDATRDALTPADLPGRRVGIRSYTVTTVMWLRGVLAHDFGIDPDAIKWVTFEDAHVANFPDPPGVERAGPDKDMMAMLKSGELDAAIVGKPADDEAIRPIIADPAAAAHNWQARYGAIQVNHLVAVKSEMCRSQPEIVREVYRLFSRSKQAAGLPEQGASDTNPLGIAANRSNLEIAIQYACEQRLIPRQFTVDELFDDCLAGVAD